MIRDWNLQQDRIEEENNKTPTPVPPTPEPPKTEVKVRDNRPVFSYLIRIHKHLVYNFFPLFSLQDCQSLRFENQSRDGCIESGRGRQGKEKREAKRTK